MPAYSNQEKPLEDTRQRIIAAAMQLYGQVGYSQATTCAIAEAAGINEVTLFRHFGNKKNLLKACIETHNASGFTATFETELTGNYPADILYMGHLQIKDTTANMDVLHLLMCDARNVPELCEAMLAGGRGNATRLSCYFQRQIDNGVVRPDLPADVLVLAFDGLFSWNVIFENLFQGSLSPRALADEVIRPLVDLFVRGTQLTPDSLAEGKRSI